MNDTDSLVNKYEKLTNKSKTTRLRCAKGEETVIMLDGEKKCLKKCPDL